MKKTNNKKMILLFTSIILLFVVIINVNALIIGNREDSNFKGVIDEIRIYNRALSEEEAIQHYYSVLYKYDIDKWSFYTNQSNLAEGTYTYYGCAKDIAENNNCTETRVLTICVDIDKDDICDKDEPEVCRDENQDNIPPDTDCITYNGFDYETGCWKKTFKVIGTPCNLNKWHYNYSCSSDKTMIIKRYYNRSCNGAGHCNVISIGNVEAQEQCSTTRECFGPNFSNNPENYQCICKSDIDGDKVCDGDDLCPKENSTNFEELTHISNDCITYDGFDDKTGCHINTTHLGMIIPEPCPEATCYNPPQVNWTCNEAGGKYIPNQKDCGEMIQECKGDPDFNLTACAKNFSKSEDDVICEEYEEECWSAHKPYYSMWGDGGCCGDDSIRECWIDAGSNACCYYESLAKVVYLTDPDESKDYCLLLGKSITGQSASYCENRDTYCWDSNSKQCCGDDLNETWEFSTSYYIGDVLVNETCYQGYWSVVKEKKTTYFDLISQLLNFFR